MRQHDNYNGLTPFGSRASGYVLIPGVHSQVHVACATDTFALDRRWFERSLNRIRLPTGDAGRVCNTAFPLTNDLVSTSPRYCVSSIFTNHKNPGVHFLIPTHRPQPSAYFHFATHHSCLVLCIPMSTPDSPMSPDAATDIRDQAQPSNLDRDHTSPTPTIININIVHNHYYLLSCPNCQRKSFTQQLLDIASSCQFRV